VNWNTLRANVTDPHRIRHAIKRSTAVRAAAGLGITGVCTAAAAQYTTHPVLSQLVLAAGGIITTVLTKTCDEDLMAELDPPDTTTTATPATPTPPQTP